MLYPLDNARYFFCGEEVSYDTVKKNFAEQKLAPWNVWGIFSGRFMPYHNGHFNAHQQLNNLFTHIHIGIVNPNPWHTKLVGERFTLDKNFLEYHERAEMIAAANENLQIIKSPKIAPYFPDRYYGEELHRAVQPPLEKSVLVLAVRDAFDESKLAHYRKKQRHLLVLPTVAGADGQEYSATRVRKLMLEGNDWRMLVPSFTAAVIDKYHCVERLRDLTADALRHTPEELSR